MIRLAEPSVQRPLGISREHLSACDELVTSANGTREGRAKEYRQRRHGQFYTMRQSAAPPA